MRRHHRHPDGPRKLRRLRARQQALAEAMTPELPPELRRARKAARRSITFGSADPRQGDRREKERRADRTPAEQEAVLRRMGQEDRRRGQRRSGGDRRR